MAGKPIVDPRHAQPHESGGKSHPVRFNCVVLTRADDQACSDELLQGLTKRGGKVQIVANPAAVLVHLARDEVGAVIIEQPKQTRRLSELLAAIQRYYPKTVCWHFDAVGTDGRGRLARFDPPSHATDEPDPDRDFDPHQDPISLDEPHQLNQFHEQEQAPDDQLPSEDEVLPAADGAEESDEASAEHDGPFQIGLSNPLITEDEMAMLLGNDFDDIQVDADDEAFEMEAHP